ncbi:MAG: amino acid adenylation domain-containing protein, partial [Chloroflexota bacterium]
SLHEEEGMVKGYISYNSDLFETETMTRMASHYQQIMSQAVQSPQRPISEFELLTAKERQQILIDWNDTEATYPHTECVHQLIASQAAKTPDRVAVIGPASKITYQALDERANQVAHHLQSMGVKPGSLVGILTERSVDMVIAMIGVLKAGAAYVPMDPAYPTRRLSHMIMDADLNVILTDQMVADVLPSYQGKRVYIDRDWHIIEKQPTTPTLIAVAPEDVAYVIYTSGSTGLPKGVQIPHRALVNFLHAMQDKPGLTEQDVLLSITTLSFDISGLEIYLPLITGAKVVVVSQETTMDGTILIKAIGQYQPTVMQATPATWHLLIDSGWQGTPNLKVLCGGEAISLSLAKQLLSRVKSLWNMYGPTETTIWSTTCELKANDSFISIGRPIANTQLYILDDDLQPVPVGIAGNLYIGGDGLAKGYLNRDELTKEKFIPHPFAEEANKRIYLTGDLARYLPDGQIECLGRIDHQVKIRGVRIELGEIENILRDHPSVQEVVVIVREDQPSDKRLVAYVVSNENPSVSELRRFAQEQLPNYMTPTTFVMLERLPLTPNGKINRLALPKPNLERPDLEDVFIAPRTDKEKQLAAIWQSVLQIEQVGLHDNFFDLGGYSLLAVRLFEQIEQVFDIRLPLASLFQAPTVYQLAQCVSQTEGDDTWPTLVPIQPTGSKTPLFFVHAAGGNVLLYRDLAKHLGPDQPVYGWQAQGLDGIQPLLTSVEAMAKRYIGELKGVQPSGPYRIGGYCGGGTIAYEIAQQLVAQGDIVETVILFETYNWANLGTASKWGLAHYWLQKFEFHIRNFLLLNTGGKQTFLAEKWDVLKDRQQVWQGHLKNKFGQSAETQDAQNLLLSQVWQNNDAVAAKYKPQPYPGRILFFRPVKEYTAYAGPKLGWEHLVGKGVDTYTVSAFPAAMLVEPFVKEVASVLTERLG